MLEGADLAEIGRVFRVYEVKDEGTVTRLYGEPLADASAFYGTLYPYFARKGLAVRVEHSLGEFVVTVAPAPKDPVWLNAALAIATVVTTTMSGALLYGVNPIDTPLDIYKGLPFAAAIMLVLGSHELSHYLASRKHGVDATLPYFIPLPLPPIGTMGAIIRQKGPVPTRRALFDVGISGPLIGLIIAIAVTVLGLMLPLMPAGLGLGGLGLHPNAPPLFGALLAALHPGAAVDSVNPIAFAGWVGMLVTMLNLLPVGQLDGGHVSRAILGPFADRLSRIIPMGLMILGIYGIFGLNQDGEIWILWGLITSFMSMTAHPKPTDDRQPIGWPRVAVACVMVVLALLCFTPFPFPMP